MKFKFKGAYQLTRTLTQKFKDLPEAIQGKIMKDLIQCIQSQFLITFVELKKLMCIQFKILKTLSKYICCYSINIFIDF